MPNALKSIISGLLMVSLIAIIVLGGWGVKTATNEASRSLDNSQQASASTIDAINPESAEEAEAVSQDPDRDNSLESQTDEPEEVRQTISQYRCSDVVSAIDDYEDYKCYDWPIFDDTQKLIKLDLPKICDDFPIVLNNKTRRLYCLDYPGKKLVPLTEGVDDYKLNVIEQESVILKEVTTDLLR